MSRRIPSSLSICLRSCQLYRAGQTCYNCPNRGLSTCPIPDIEDLFLNKNKTRTNLTLPACEAEPISLSVEPQKKPIICNAEYFIRVEKLLVIENSAAAVTVQNSQENEKVNLKSGAGCGGAEQASAHLRSIPGKKFGLNYSQQAPKAKSVGSFFQSFGILKYLAGIPAPVSRMPGCVRHFSVSGRTMSLSSLNMDVHTSHQPPDPGLWDQSIIVHHRLASASDSPPPADAATSSALVPMSSLEGRALFTEALGGGGLESYFPLSEQYLTQTDPALSAVRSRTVVCAYCCEIKERRIRMPC